jgi:hypothetical protein
LLPVADSGKGAHLALLEEHAGDNLVEQADQAEHGVIRQMLLSKLALRMPTSYQDPVEFVVALAASHSVLCAAEMPTHKSTAGSSRAPLVVSCMQESHV